MLQINNLKTLKHRVVNGIPAILHPSHMPTTDQNNRLRALLVLAASVLIVSGAAIMIRLAQQDGVPSVSIATWRLGLAAVILSGVVLLRSDARAEVQTLSVRTIGHAIAAGIFLAAHFAAWIASLAYTSVASSMVLVSTNPIWIAIFSWLVFGEKPTRALVLGIGFAILGSTFIFLSDARGAGTSAGSDPLWGNLLAVAGSLTVCGYLLLGRRLRQHMSLLTYVWLVYLSAGVTLLLGALAAGAPLTGFSGIAWLFLAGLALGPQLLGHSGINWALKHLSATVIAMAILAEPIGSALLAWWFFGESFAVLQLVGFVLLLTGIYLASQPARTVNGEPARI